MNRSSHNYNIILVNIIMPRRQGYRKRAPRRRRLGGSIVKVRKNPLATTKYGSVTHGGHFLRGTNRVAALYDAAVMAHQAVKALHPIIKDIPPMHDTRSGKVRSKAAKSKSTRHEKLKQAGTANSKVNKGKGFNSKKDGVVHTHHKSVIPAWKRKRHNLYRFPVWQTVLLSKSNRLPASNNTLETCRYPLQCPTALDSERVQTMLFQPFCSHFSGIHSSMYRKVRADGTALEHNTTDLLDTIQNKADIARQDLPPNVDGSQNSAIVYESDISGGSITAATARGVGNIAQIHNYYDQLVRSIKVDLVFTASRPFPVKVSVSVVRLIQANAPSALTDDQIKQLCNNLDNKGMEWESFRTEWLTTFTLPALRLGKKPPTRSINKTLKTSFLQTNTFQQDNVAQAMAQSATTQLGKSIDVRANETVDGHVSGQFVILIKYRKVQGPQQFEYKHTIQSNAGRVVGEVTLPVLTNESYDVPVASGFGVDGQDGAPFSTDQGDESKASMMVHGKLVTEWGFRKQPEAIPSIVSSDPSSADYRKAQSLMICPDFPPDNTHGIYTQSPDHVQLAASTANNGP